MSSTIHPKRVRVVGYSGSGVVAFEGELEHGRGRRTVALHVEPETILRLAAELIAAGYTTDLDGGTPRRRWACSHAIHHLDEETSTAPCEMCGPVQGSTDLVSGLRYLAEKR